MITIIVFLAFYTFEFIVPYFETSCLTSNTLILNEVQNRYKVYIGYKSNQLYNTDIQSYPNFNFNYILQLCQKDALKNSSILSYFQYLKDNNYCMFDDIMFEKFTYLCLFLFILLVIELFDLWLIYKNNVLYEKLFTFYDNLIVILIYFISMFIIFTYSFHQNVCRVVF